MIYRGIDHRKWTRNGIITVRGACGSGKSTIVRNWLYGPGETLTKVYAEDRANPVGYVNDKVFVAGHYERDTMGGIDTFKTVTEAHAHIVHWASLGRRVLYEGKAQEEGADDMLQLSRRSGSMLMVVHLTTSLEDCIASVRGRATANGIRDEIIGRSWRRAQRESQDLAGYGVSVHYVTRAEAMELINESLHT